MECALSPRNLFHTRRRGEALPPSPPPPSLGKLHHHRDVTTMARGKGEREREGGRGEMRYGRSVLISLPLSLSPSVIFPGGYLRKAWCSLHKATGSSRSKMPRNYASLLSPCYRPSSSNYLVVTSSACNSVALPP